MMKKRWILLMMCACISGLGGCGKQTVTEKARGDRNSRQYEEDTTELCAYIKGNQWKYTGHRSRGVYQFRGQ